MANKAITKLWRTWVDSFTGAMYVAQGSEGGKGAQKGQHGAGMTFAPSISEEAQEFLRE